MDDAIKKLFGDPFSTLLTGAAEVISKPDGVSLTQAEVGKADFSDDDYLFIRSRFVTSRPFVNANKDAFLAEDLEEITEGNQLTPAMPGMLDLNHDFFPYGVVIEKKLIPAQIQIAGEDKDVVQLEVLSVLWAWRFPEVAAKVKRWHEKGKLSFSMACRSKYFECGDCGTVAHKESEFCEHLKDRTYTSRNLRKPKFYANSIITPDNDPADSNAQSVTVASRDSEQYWVVRDQLHTVYDDMWGQVYSIINEGVQVPARVRKVFDAGKESYLALYKVLKDIAQAYEQVYVIDVRKTIAADSFVSLPWVLRSVLSDIEWSGVDDSEKFIAKAFDDTRDAFVDLWKAMSPEQRKQFTNTQVVVSETTTAKLEEGASLMDEKLKELQAQLEAATSRVKELETQLAGRESEDLKAELDSAKAELATAQGALETATKEVEAIAAEKEDLVKKVELLEAANADLQVVVDGYRSKEAEAIKAQAETINTERASAIDAWNVSDERKAIYKERFAVAVNESGELVDANSDLYRSLAEDFGKREPNVVGRSRAASGLSTASRDTEGGAFKSTMA